MFRLLRMAKRELIDRRRSAASFLSAEHCFFHLNIQLNSNTNGFHMQVKIFFIFENDSRFL